jgi:hypothetical protein
MPRYKIENPDTKNSGDPEAHVSSRCEKWSRETKQDYGRNPKKASKCRLPKPHMRE